MSELDTSIVGVHFRPSEAKELLNSLSPGAPLTLEREPSNEYDGNAIRVHADDVHVGYIPRTENTVLAALMDAGDAEPVAELLCLGKNPSIIVRW